MKRRRSHVWPKAKDGWYQEPLWCSHRLFEVERVGPPGSPLWDPACGIGTVVNAARIAGYDACGTDIVCRSPNLKPPRFRTANFLKAPAPLPQGTSIVCNPPFTHLEQFCRHALELGAAKVAMIMQVRRLNAAHWLRELPLARIWLLTPRPSMPPGEWIAAGNKPGGGREDFCWVVFSEAESRKPPEVGWLHRDGRPPSEAER